MELDISKKKTAFDVLYSSTVIDVYFLGFFERVVSSYFWRFLMRYIIENTSL